MKKLLIIQYDTDNDMHNLTVADPDVTLPNGNKKIIKILMGGLADKTYEQLTTGEGLFMDISLEEDQEDIGED